MQKYGGQIPINSDGMIKALKGFGDNGALRLDKVRNCVQNI